MKGRWEGSYWVRALSPVHSWVPRGPETGRAPWGVTQQLHKLHPSSILRKPPVSETSPNFARVTGKGKCLQGPFLPHPMLATPQFPQLVSTPGGCWDKAANLHAKHLVCTVPEKKNNKNKTKQKNENFQCFIFDCSCLQKYSCEYTNVPIEAKYLFNI